MSQIPTPQPEGHGIARLPLWQVQEAALGSVGADELQDYRRDPTVELIPLAGDTLAVDGIALRLIELREKLIQSLAESRADDHKDPRVVRFGKLQKAIEEFKSTYSKSSTTEE